MEVTKINNCDQNSFLCDFRFYFIKRPDIKTLVQYKSPAEKESFRQRILNHLGVSVSEYSILNIHKIGIDAPADFVFEQLLNWDGTSDYWPNNIARVKRIDGSLENILIYMFGIEKINFSLLPGKQINFKPMFNMTGLKFQHSSSPSDSGNARYLLYNCSGGYPIGIFSLYVHNSISEGNEKGEAQLYSIVAFNFYGKKNWFYTGVINPVWEKIHNRVTNNVLNRMKLEFENKFHDVISLKGSNIQV